MTTLARPALGLRAARWVLLALVGITLLGVVISLVLAPGYIRTHRDAFGLSEGWTPALIQAALTQLHWPAETVAWFAFGRSLLVYAGTLLPGLLVLRRRSHDWFGLYVAFAFVVVPALTVMEPMADGVPGLRAAGELAGALGWQFYFILFYVFPDGRFVPRWTRWLIPIWVATNVISRAVDNSDAPSEWLPGLILIQVGLVFSAIGSQVYRYFRRSGSIQRQQTKWVVLVLVVTMGSTFWLGPAFQGPFRGQETLGTNLMRELGRVTIINVVFVLVPIAMAVAILRYRLWDIDLLIRRTLIYSVLTALLGLAYFGSVLVLQNVFQALTGEGQNALATVLSTLTIAALFGPLRGRVQQAIDRRFFRQKYDAARTLAAFGAQARDVVDLEQLSEELVQAVEATMQPAHVGLWVRKAAGR